jgi:predicted metal-dependent HD superfamily phosphohydrolase
MIATEPQASLLARWVECLARYAVEEAAAHPLFRRLAAAYSAPERHYHTLEHLDEMFSILNRLSPTLADPGVVHLAVWFHDAVYDTRKRDNEERSAELACELLILVGLPVAVIDRVRQLIRATAHFVKEGPPDADSAALVDADLAILGAAPGRYLRYASDIRLEYDWVAEPEYRIRRAAVLRKFLARPRIYHCPLLLEEREALARQNLRAELALLTGSGTVLPPETL